MKILTLFSFFLFTFSALAQTQLEAREVTDFIGGIVKGMHIERIAPSIHKCVDSATEVRTALEHAIHAFNEHQDFYHLVNNITFGMKTLSPFSRECADMPEDVWKHLKENYFKKFNYSWEKYIHAVFLNLGYRMDEIVTDAIRIQTYIEKRDYSNAGYYSGDILNVVFNVTTPTPVPLPEPVLASVEEERILEVSREMSETVMTNWTDVHEKFRAYFNHTMIVFNYTKWVNATTFNNLNSSVANVEMKLYTSLSEFTKPVPDVKEAVLGLIDITLYLNDLFNGIYFSIKQVPEKMLKDTIFEHLDYLYVNLIQHSGYFIYNGYKLVDGILHKRYMDVCRRATIILRKILYFDEDVLDEINNKVPAKDI